MKKIFTLLSFVALGISANAQTDAFLGSNFETWSQFTSSINSFGLKSYATQGVGTGYNASNSLNITTVPTTTSGNDYVFTALANATSYPSSIKEITFWVKGSSDKSLSLNVYMANGTNYNVFNVKDLSASATYTPTAIGASSGNGTNDYIGLINTGGAWVKVTLDMSTITDVNKTDATKNFFALKIGKSVNYSLDIDDIKVVSSTMGTIDIKEFDKKVKMNTLVAETLTLELPSKSTVNIYSIDGKLVSSNRVNSGESINVSKLQKGNYIVTVEDGTNKVSRKIVKK